MNDRHSIANGNDPTVVVHSIICVVEPPKTEQFVPVVYLQLGWLTPAS